MIHDLLVSSSATAHLNDYSIYVARCNGYSPNNRHGFRMTMSKNLSSNYFCAVTKYIPNSRMGKPNSRLSFDIAQLKRVLDTGYVPNKQVKLIYYSA